MLARCLPLAACAGVLLAGCAGSGSAPTHPASGAAPAVPGQVALGTALLTGDLAQSALGLYTLELDAASLSASASLKASRTGAQNDDLYQLSIDNFLRSDSFQVTRFTRSGSEVILTCQVTHPFPAPADAFGLPNGFTNRADLSIAGQILVLADVPTTTGNAFFSDRIANTALITNADAYYSPAGLLNLTTTANTFPYLSLVDENGDGSRVGIPNGGDPTGNFGPDGWTRAEFGANNDGWTGFGVLHQGQRSERDLHFDLAALQAAGTFALDVAILAKYNDPRGGLTAAQKRSNRLPPASPDADLFAYRMPHGAIDVEQIAFAGESGGFMPNQISASTLSFQVVDWDARAIETTAPDLSEDLDVTTVAVGESGLPGFAVCIPGVLGDASTVETFDVGTDVLDDDSAFGGDPEPDSGRPGDRLLYQRAVTKTITSGQTAGMYVGLARATDVETGLVVPLDGETLLPLSSNLPEPVTYQAFQVTMGALNAPPTASYVVATPNVSDGGNAAISVTGLADAEGDDIDILVDWDDNGTYTLATTVMSPYPGAVPVSSPITYTHTPPAPDIRDLPVRISDGFSTIDLLPTGSFTVLPPGAGCPTPPVTGADRGPWGSTSTLYSWSTFYGAAVTRGPADFGAFHSATLNEFIVHRYYTTAPASFEFYRLTPTTPPVFTQMTNFGAALLGQQAHQIEADSTNRVLFATKGPSSSDGDANEIYGTGASSQAFADIKWFDYDGSTMPATFNTISTAGNRVVALTLDQLDNLYYIDVNNILHKLNKATNYTEDTSAPFPLDLKLAPFSRVPTTWRVNDFVINFHNQAFFLLFTNTSNSFEPFVMRIDCDGTLYTSIGATNPATFEGYYSNGGHDIYIDQWTTGATLTNEADVQIVVANAVLTASSDGPGFRIFNSDLVNTATWSGVGVDSYGKIAITNNVMVGKDEYFASGGFHIHTTPPAGWQ